MECTVSLFGPEIQGQGQACAIHACLSPLTLPDCDITSTDMDHVLSWRAWDLSNHPLKQNASLVEYLSSPFLGYKPDYVGSHHDEKKYVTDSGWLELWRAVRTIYNLTRGDKRNSESLKRNPTNNYPRQWISRKKTETQTALIFK